MRSDDPSGKTMTELDSLRQALARKLAEQAVQVAPVQVQEAPAQVQEAPPVPEVYHEPTSEACAKCGAVYPVEELLFDDISGDYTCLKCDTPIAVDELRQEEEPITEVSTVTTEESKAEVATEVTNTPELASKEKVEEVKPPKTASVQIDNWDIRFKPLIQALSVTSEEATLGLTVDGIVCRLMDPSHVSMVDAVLSSADYYRYDVHADLKATMRVQDVLKILKNLDRKERLSIDVVENESMKLKAGGSSFTVHLIEASSGDTPVPKLNYNTSIVFELKVFIDILKKIHMLSEQVTITTATNRKVVFSGKSDMGDVEETIDYGDARLLEVNTKEDSQATYSVEYLLNIMQALRGCHDVVKLEYSSKMPIRLTVYLGGSNISPLHFYLAPRIEEK